MDFEKLFNDLAIKADNLDVAMKVFPHKSTIFKENITTMSDDCKEIKNLELMVKKSLEQHNNVIKEEYSEVKEIIQNVNEKMLFLLGEMEKVETISSKENFMNVLSEMKSPAVNRPGGSKALFNELNTPRMSIEQYAKSPFTKRKLQLKFSDFDANVTAAEFEKIPSYIRGRINHGDLQHFLNEVVIKCFNSKYELYYKNRACLKPSDYNLQLFYKEQSSYFEGQKFITLGDLSRTLDKNVDKKDEKFLQCLRFLQIIKEARKNSATCYIWIEK